MSKRVCSRPGCGVLVSAGSRGGRCPRCEREHDKARGTRQERGYDAGYDRDHRAWQRRLDAGEVVMCWRCPELGRPVHAVDPRPGYWHLGHDVVDRDIIRGPQCPASNLATAQSSR